jgi:hypothetical protein
MSPSLGVCTEPYMRFSFIPSFYVHYIYTLGTMCDLSMGVWIDTCS